MMILWIILADIGNLLVLCQGLLINLFILQMKESQASVRDSYAELRDRVEGIHEDDPKRQKAFWNRGVELINQDFNKE